MTTDWRHRAVCRDEDPELFFPIGTTGPALVQIEEAKAVCRRCPAAAECLGWALETGQSAGVWGGMSEDERRALPRPAPQPTTPTIPIPEALTPLEATALLRRLQRHHQPAPLRVVALAHQYEGEKRRAREAAARARRAALLPEEAAS